MAQPMPPDAHLLIVGDSLVAQSRAPLVGLLADLDADVRAENRTTVGDWAGYLSVLLEREAPDVLVVALGTNDNLAYDEPAGASLAERAAAYSERVNVLLDVTADVPCRIWIEPSPMGFDPRYPENAAALNAVLARLLADHGVRLVSWGEWMTGGDAFENGWMRPDSIHLTESGQSVYAALIAGAARDGCR